VAIDLDHDRLVRDVQVTLHNVRDLAVLLDHLVQNHGVGDDSGDATIHPDLQIFRITGKPNCRSCAGATVRLRRAN
jgi:hypothetical protein